MSDRKPRERIETTAGEGRGPRVAVLGTGTMGSAMARRLLSAGLPVVAWTRTWRGTRVEELVAAGAVAARDPSSAVAGADVVLTLLPTAEAVDEVMLGGDVLAALAPRAVWAQMATIGLDATRRLAAAVERERPDVQFVDAPVSGSRAPAESGQLLVLASGPDGARAALEPVFDAVGRQTLWLGRAGAGTALKLVLNTWLAFEVEAAAEAAALARRLGVPGEQLREAATGNPLASQLALAKLAKAASGDHSADFSLAWALKDLDLAAAAGGEETAPAAAAIASRWRGLVDGGLGDLDVSAASLRLDPDGDGRA